MIYELMEEKAKKYKYKLYSISDILTDEKQEQLKLAFDSVMGVEIKPNGYVYLNGKEKHHFEFDNLKLSYCEVTTTEQIDEDIIKYMISIYASLPVEEIYMEGDFKEIDPFEAPVKPLMDEKEVVSLSKTMNDTFETIVDTE